jgi:hypothetical protein
VSWGREDLAKQHCPGIPSAVLLKKGSKMLSAQLIPLGTFSSAPPRIRGVMELMYQYTLQRDRGWAGFVHTKLANG